MKLNVELSNFKRLIAVPEESLPPSEISRSLIHDFSGDENREVESSSRDGLVRQGRHCGGARILHAGTTHTRWVFVYSSLAAL